MSKVKFEPKSSQRKIPQSSHHSSPELKVPKKLSTKWREFKAQ